MHLVVYTTILGDTDPLRPIRTPNPAVRYLCFADRPVQALGWDVIQIAPDPPLPIQSRRLKLLAHETLALWRPDISLWLDAAFELHADPAAIAAEWLSDETVDMVALKHPHRNRIADEGTQIVKLGYADSVLVAQQLLDAADAGFPLDRQSAITSTGFCLRRHNARVQAFNTRWWDLFVQGGHGRDQMSVDWALWDSPITLRYLEGHYKDNPYATWHAAGAPGLPAGVPTRFPLRRPPPPPAPPARVVGRRVQSLLPRTRDLRVPRR